MVFVKEKTETVCIFQVKIPDLYFKCQKLKGEVSRDFLPLFFSLMEPIWSPDKQAKMVFLKNSFSPRYLNLKLEKFDFMQANTARSRFVF